MDNCHTIYNWLRYLAKYEWNYCDFTEIFLQNWTKLLITSDQECSGNLPCRHPHLWPGAGQQKQNILRPTPVHPRTRHTRHRRMFKIFTFARPRVAIKILTNCSLHQSRCGLVIAPCILESFNTMSTTLQNTRHDLFGDWNSAGCLDECTSWYFSWKFNYFGIPKWKYGLFNIPQSGHESV